MYYFAHKFTMFPIPKTCEKYFRVLENPCGCPPCVIDKNQGGELRNIYNCMRCWRLTGAGISCSVTYDYIMKYVGNMAKYENTNDYYKNSVEFYIDQMFNDEGMPDDDFCLECIRPSVICTCSLPALSATFKNTRAMAAFDKPSPQVNLTVVNILEPRKKEKPLLGRQTFDCGYDDCGSDGRRCWECRNHDGKK